MTEADVQNMQQCLERVKTAKRTALADEKFLAVFGKKYCRCCGVARSQSDFGSRASARDGYAATCNTCRAEYREKNGDHHRAYSREKYHKNIDLNRTLVRKWQETNRELARESCRKWRQNNPDAQKKAGQNWRKNNPGKNAALAKKRYTAMRRRIPKWITDTELKIMMELYVEAARKTQETGEQWHVDHIIPLQGKTVSGLHVPSNLRVILALDNVRKQNKLMEELM